MKILLIKTGMVIALLYLSIPTYSVTTTYSLDKEQVCSSISNSPNFGDFLSLREFFRVNPAFASDFNLGDPRYCLKLQLAYSLFNKSDDSANEASQFYTNCMALDDQQIAFQNESFIRVQSIIINCHLN